MQDIESPKFAESLAKVGRYYGRRVDSELTEIYWEALKEFELSEIENAFVLHYRQTEAGRFFPRIADLIRFLEGSEESRALVAWTLVQDAIQSIGRYPSIAFEDPFIHVVLEDMGGWIELCGMTLEALPFKAMEFQKRYGALTYKPPQRHPRYLVGLIERDNAKEGHPYPAPVLFGDQQKARGVMNAGTAKPLLTQVTQLACDLIQKIYAIEKDPQKLRD